MKKPLRHILVALAAAGAGWLTGAPSTEAKPARARRAAAGTAAVRAGAGRFPWEAQIAAVRGVPGARSETAWVKWAFAIPDAEIPAAIARLNPCADFHALRCLYCRWAKLNPAAAWTSFRKSRIPETVQQFGMPRPGDAGGSMVNTIAHSNPRALIASRMLASMEVKDPAAAKALALKLRTAGSDDAKDVAAVGYLPSELERILDQKKDQSPATNEQTLIAAAAVKEERDRRAGVEKAWRGWLETDPAAACAWLRQLPEAERKSLTLFNLTFGLSRASPEDRARTIALVYEGRESSGGSDVAVIATGAVKTWTGQDPAAVRSWIAGLPEGDIKATFAGSAAGILVRTDVDAAVGLLNQTGGDQNLAVNALVRGWVETDARAALAWVGKIDDAVLRDHGRATAALELAVADPSLAIETARLVTDPTLRDGVYKNVRDALSWNSVALQELQERFPAPEWNSAPK